ncbi:hypothetical protein Tco_0799601 [Tanacetum coccineum]|uniref:Uncharacterized protein n=1 Tax=Tanacetum coccineum TaxID=301880 RepID=A0ABQ4ZV58_9ASTR
MLSLGLCFCVWKMGRGGKGMGKRKRSSKRLNGDQALTNHVEPTVMADVSQPDIVHSYPTNGKGLNGDNNMEEVLHMVHETTSNVTGSFDADKSTQSLKKNVGSKLSDENIINALFGVPLSSIKDLDALTRKNEKLLADVTSTTNVPINEGTGPKEDTPIVKSVSFTKLVSYVGAAGASSSKPSTCKANFHHLVSNNVFVVVQLSIPMNVVQTSCILELKQRNLKKYCSDNLYAVSSKEDTVYLYLHFTRNHEELKSNTPYPKDSIRTADREGLIEKVITETMTEPTMEEYVNKTLGDYYSGITKAMINGKAAYEFKEKFLDDLWNNPFIGTNGEDA